MGSLSQFENELFQNSISFLHNISSLGSATPALKCLYLTKARLMELRKNIQVPSNLTGTTVRCQRCFLTFIDGPATYQIKAAEKKSKFARKMLSKINRDKPMTKYQRKYIKYMNTFSGNQLVITCKYCKKEASVKLDKPKKPVKVVKRPASKRKKIIKKKDKFCGLKKEVVISATPPKDKTPSGSSRSQKSLQVAPPKVKNVESTNINRNFDTSEFIPLEVGAKQSRFKLSKKETVNTTAKEIVPKLSVRESQSKLKRKSKLKEFLNTSNSNKQGSSNLKNFLQGL